MNVRGRTAHQPRAMTARGALLVSMIAALAGCDGGPDAGPIDAPAAETDAAEIDAAATDASATDAAELDAAQPDAAAPDAAIDAPGSIDAPAGNAALVIEPSAIDFGIIEVGFTAPDQTVTVRNTGGAATGVVLSTDSNLLVIVSNTCGVVAAGGTCTATLRLTVDRQGANDHEFRALAISGASAIAPVTALGGYRLTVQVNGLGIVASTPAGINCGSGNMACTALFSAPPVMLTATPTGPDGSFVGWSAPCNAIGTAPCSFTITGPTTITAVFHTPATLTLRTDGLGAGYIAQNTVPAWCATGPCTYGFNAGTMVTLTHGTPLPGSGFAGWGGACSGTASTCTVTVSGAVEVTATFVPAAPATWQRTSPQPGRPYDVALTSDGVIVVGTTRVTSTNNALWWTHIRTNGDVAATVIDDVTTTNDAAFRVAVAPDGDVIVATTTGANASSFGTLAVRRYSPAGALRWSRSPGGAGARHGNGVAVDHEGNVYATGDPGGAPYVVSYTPAGAERWRRTHAQGGLHAVAVRGDIVAIAGKVFANGSDDGFIATYDRAGTPGWSRVVVRDTYGSISFVDVGIDSDGDVVVGGDASPSGVTTNAFLVVSVRLDGAAELWRQRVSARGGSTSELFLGADDTMAVWAGHVQSFPEHSTLRRIAEDGTVGPTTTVLGIEKADGLAVDAAGAAITAGLYQMTAWPLIEREPLP